MSLPELETQVRIQNLKLKQKDAEIKKLKGALHLFMNNESSPQPIEVDKEQDELMHSGSEDEEMNVEIDPAEGDQEEEEGEEGQGEGAEPRKPLFDMQTGLYFCTDCLAEIDEGLCILCGDKYEWQEEDPLRNTESTRNQAIHYDRSLVPRGDTPLLPDSMFDHCQPPLEYRQSRKGEYKELLRRGATRIMCETFHLQFSQQGGIYAWADPQLFEEFSGPAMKENDFWKIHLGRRVTLDHDDEDGSAFIDGLLEDALFFPFRKPTSERTFEQWETVEDTPGIWVTRLKAHRDPFEETMDDENEYESDTDWDEYSDFYDSDNDDMPLETPPIGDTGPIRADKYTLSGSEDEEDGDSEDETIDEEDEDEDDDHDHDENEDMGAFITARALDAVWKPDEDKEEDEGADEYAISEIEPSESQPLVIRIPGL